MLNRERSTATAILTCKIRQRLSSSHLCVCCVFPEKALMHTLSFFLGVFKKNFGILKNKSIWIQILRVCSWEVQYVKEKQKCPFLLSAVVSRVVYVWGLSGCQALLLNYKDIGV